MKLGKIYVYFHKPHSLKLVKKLVSYQRYFLCNNCFLLLVYNINLSSTDFVDPPPMGTFFMKHALGPTNMWESENM